MFKTRNRRVTALTGAELAVVATVLAGVAVAAPDASTSQAPLRAGRRAGRGGRHAHALQGGGCGHRLGPRLLRRDRQRRHRPVPGRRHGNTSRHPGLHTVRVIPGGCAGGNGISVATYNPTGGGRATAFHLAVL